MALLAWVEGCPMLRLLDQCPNLDRCSFVLVGFRDELLRAASKYRKVVGVEKYIAGKEGSGLGFIIKIHHHTSPSVRVSDGVTLQDGSWWSPTSLLGR
jgi:hypothetical protein